MKGIHVEGVAEGERDQLVFAEIGEPELGKHALETDHGPLRKTVHANTVLRVAT